MGPYQVGVKVIPLTDPSRTEANSTAHREILLSIYYPTTRHSNTEETQIYLPNVSSGLFETSFGFPAGSVTKLHTNSYSNSQLNPHFGRPSTGGVGCDVIVFSPGLGAPRLLYTALLEDAASHGRVVVSIDHPGDAEIVEFPDGHIVYSSVPADYVTNLTLLNPFYETRLADVQFLTRSLPSLPVLNRCPIKQLGIFGHSFGGATAGGTIQALQSSYAGGVNLDGAFFGVEATGGPAADLKKPFLLMSSSIHSSATDDTWTAFEKAQTGWLHELALNGSQHLTYFDLGPVVDSLGLAGSFNSTALEAIIGTIDPKRALFIQRTFLKAFFDFVFTKKKTSPILEGPSEAFPEIYFTL